jgi:hypothetical protein
MAVAAIVAHDGLDHCNHRGPWRLGSLCFQKNCNFFMNSDGDKLYTKLVAFQEIYNFVVQTFSFEVILRLKNLIYCPDLPGNPMHFQKDSNKKIFFN